MVTSNINFEGVPLLVDEHSWSKYISQRTFSFCGLRSVYHSYPYDACLHTKELAGQKDTSIGLISSCTF